MTSAWWIACLLVLAERLGKAVWSPAKDTMLAEAGTGLGRGKAYAFMRRWIRSAPSLARF